MVAARADAVVAAAQAPGGGCHDDGCARVVLTGGGAGIAVLKAWASLDSAVDWSRVHVFFGDERAVDVNDPESNEGQARTALLHHRGVPEEHIHGWSMGELDLDHATSRYAELLERFAPRGFDLHLLGLGPEGHVNSIFPHSCGASPRAPRVIAVTDSPKPPARRGSLSLPGVRLSDRVWLLASGAQKAEAAAAVAEDRPISQWPAAGARGRIETVLVVDQAAGAQIDQPG
ncbi:6-phosphogluconolactonase [Corynebacterium atypicum]|uniref:6-phosphogluconolactonase n=1 Tax=Corynebacterium atypicum TaxID=191610 RepID=UPI001EED9CAB|nr:6-phosphogluconolactonase [Corynebacterium atypicum]